MIPELFACFERSATAVGTRLSSQNGEVVHDEKCVRSCRSVWSNGSSASFLSNFDGKELRERKLLALPLP